MILKCGIIEFILVAKPYLYVATKKGEEVFVGTFVSYGPIGGIP